MDPVLRTMAICLAIGIALDALIIALWLWSWP